MTNAEQRKCIHRLGKKLYENGLLSGFTRINSDDVMWDDLPADFQNEYYTVTEYILEREATLSAELSKYKDLLKDALDRLGEGTP